MVFLPADPVVLCIFLGSVVALVIIAALVFSDKF